MKKIILVLCLLLSQSTWAANDLGVGFIVGDPVGVSVKKWLGNDKAIDGAAGWSFGKDPHLILQSTYLWNLENALYFNDTHPLDMYFGVGGRLDFDSEIEIAGRAPLGLSYYFNDRNAEAFAEFAILFNLVPKTDFGAQAGIGLRIYL